MAGLSDYNAENLLNHVVGLVPYPALAARYLALFTAAPTADAGTGGTEVSGGSYARVQVAGSVVTNALTAAGNAILHFAAVPAWIVAGMSVYDATAPTVLPGLTVLSTTGTTVTLSGNAAGAGVGSGDTINFSAWPQAGASTGTEPSVTPSSAANGGAITFAQATALWGDVIAWGIYDALTVGNLLFWDYLGNFAWIPASVSSASPGVLTSHAHGYAVNDNVAVSVKVGGTVPTFSASNFTGPLVVAHAATDTFDVTNAATAVNTSGTGDVMVRKFTKQTIPANVTASFAAASFTLFAA